MALQSLVDDLRLSSNVKSKITIVRRFLDRNFTDPAESKAENAQSLVALLVETVNFPLDPNGDATSSDEGFTESCRYATLLCKVIRKLTKDGSNRDGSYKFFTNCFPHYLKLIAQLQCEINLWCDKSFEDAANETLTEILSFGGWESLEEALDAEDSTIVKTTLEIILPNLTREKWKESCAGRSTFIYLIQRSNGDILAEVLDMILPFILLLTDDFVLRNSVAGIKCMNHVLNEVSSSELRLRGRAEVLHDAVLKKLYTREAAIAKVLIPCILQSLNVIEPKMMRKRGCSVPKHDQCFDTVLNNFHLSSDAAVRRIYAEAIPLFIQRMGIHSIGHMKTIAIIIEYALDVSELPIMSSCAKMMAALVDASWPRIANHSERLLEFLVKALYSIENDAWRTRGGNDDQKTQTADEIIHAMAKLALVSKDLVKETADMLESEEILALKKHSLQLKQMIETVP